MVGELKHFRSNIDTITVTIFLIAACQNENVPSIALSLNITTFNPTLLASEMYHTQDRERGRESDGLTGQIELACLGIADRELLGDPSIFLHCCHGTYLVYLQFGR